MNQIGIVYECEDSHLTEQIKDLLLDRPGREQDTSWKYLDLGKLDKSFQNEPFCFLSVMVDDKTGALKRYANTYSILDKQIPALLSRYLHDTVIETITNQKQEEPVHVFTDGQLQELEEEFER